MIDLPDPRDKPTLTPAETAPLFTACLDSWYDAVKAGTCPVPVLRIGRSIRHPTAAVLAVLGLDGLPIRNKGPIVS